MKPVSAVARIKDPLRRMTEAATLCREAESESESLRSRRDLAVLVMLRPFADAVAETNAVRARLRRDLDDGKITDDQYAALLAENREQRQADLREANPPYAPVHIYELLDVSRNLVNRILMRMPNGPLPPMSMDDAKAEAVAAHKGIPRLEQTIEKAREIRDTAALMLMSGEDDDGNALDPVTNAEIARATRLTTARIAQLRESAR